MSADNWAECPYCKAENDTAWQVRKDALDASYGKVPVESFMAERELVGHAPPLIVRTFREDYEFWTEGDTVSVDYTGSCECGASAEFHTECKINPPPKTKTNNKETAHV